VGWAGRRLLGREGQQQAFRELLIVPQYTSKQVDTDRQHAIEGMPMCAPGREPHECLVDSRRWTRRMSGQFASRHFVSRTSGKIRAGSVSRSALVVGSFYGATSTSGLQTWPNQTMPLISVQHVVGSQEVASDFVIEVQINRPITLFFTGIIIPCMLMVSGVLLQKSAIWWYVARRVRFPLFVWLKELAHTCSFARSDNIR
jgi:hypothetical protein